MAMSTAPDSASGRDDFCIVEPFFSEGAAEHIPVRRKKKDCRWASPASAVCVSGFARLPKRTVPAFGM
jgi:hypothetical protein